MSTSREKINVDTTSDSSASKAEESASAPAPAKSTTSGARKATASASRSKSKASTTQVAAKSARKSSAQVTAKQRETSSASQTKAPRRSSKASSTRASSATTRTPSATRKTQAAQAPVPAQTPATQPQSQTISDPLPVVAAQPAPFATVARIPIVDVEPVIENGAWPAKGTEHEAFPVQATVFREGHDLFGAECVLLDASGHEVDVAPMVDVAPGLRRYEGWLTPPHPGKYEFFVRAWSDPFATWRHNAEVKIDAGIDVELVFLEAKALYERAIKHMPARAKTRTVLKNAIKQFTQDDATPTERLRAALSLDVLEALAKYPVRDFVSESARYKINVDRERALVGSWYEIFPRTTGAYFDTEKNEWVSGTLQTATQGLDRIARMGFDVVYITPIHPIGTTNRKGKNNTLEALPTDPGSPYAIGSKDGGHDAINPDLGTFDDFDAFVKRAHKLGMEVALDIALQCSPDHPWVTQHPEWFTTRVDGTIAYAENPPKKYQDIYPLNFDNDPEGIYQEIKRILELWVSHGVTIFRVDNPHTKPLPFWQRLLAYFRNEHPEVIFLAEAFTQPPMMQTLAKIGFHQSYTYFAWRNNKDEICDYLMELSRETDKQLRPAFWPTTHDILTPFMQRGGIPAFAIRAVLAATGSPTWGIYSGYELAENIARPGSEELIDNEKYELKSRDYEGAEHTGIAALLEKLNSIRSQHLALRRLRNVQIHSTTNDKILCFSKTTRPEESPDGKRDMVIVVLNLDPYASREATVFLDVTAFGAEARWDDSPVLEVHDEMSGETYLWNNHPYVRLDPHGNVAHILSVKVL